MSILGVAAFGTRPCLIRTPAVPAERTRNHPRDDERGWSSVDWSSIETHHDGRVRGDTDPPLSCSIVVRTCILASALVGLIPPKCPMGRGASLGRKVAKVVAGGHVRTRYSVSVLSETSR